MENRSYIKMTGTTVGTTVVKCQICEKNTVIVEYGIAHCEICGFSWHYWASDEAIAEEVKDFLASKKKIGGYPRRFEGIFKFKQ